jgi:hypothetical protein
MACDMAMILVKFCWGMTLMLSNDPKEVGLGKNYYDAAMKAINGDDLIHTRFPVEKNVRIMSLLSLFSRTMRNVAIIRQQHVQDIEYNLHTYRKKEQFWNDITDHGNVFLKIASFVIPGILANPGLILKYVPLLGFNPQNITYNNITAAIGSHVGKLLGAKNITAAAAIGSHVGNLSQPGLNNILYFVLVGSIAMVALPLILRLFKENRLEKAQRGKSNRINQSTGGKTT